MANQNKNQGQNKDNNNSKNDLSEAAHTLRSGDSSKKEKSDAASQMGSKGGQNSHGSGRKNQDDSDE